MKWNARHFVIMIFKTITTNLYSVLFIMANCKLGCLDLRGINTGTQLASCYKPKKKKNVETEIYTQRV